MTRIITLLLLTFSVCVSAQTGCLEAINGQQPYGAFSPYCHNQFENITTVAKAGTFSYVELGANKAYSFRSSIETDFLTLSNEDGTEVILSGTHQLELTPTSDVILRFYIHADDQCASPTTFRTKSMKCDPGPDPNDPVEPVEGCLASIGPNSGIYPPFCNGFEEIISDYAFTGTYSPIEVTAGTTYTFRSSVATDHITIANALGTAVIKTGVGEVEWTAVANGEIQFHIYLDENCGIGDFDEEPRLVSVQCGDQAPPTTGCLDAPSGQVPVAVFVPTCNTVTQTVVAMANTGEYAMIAVTADMEYTFSSSVATDMLTIGNEEGTEVLSYGIGEIVWTATADELIRFYTHANSSCAMDVFTRRKMIRCGEPFVATEPEFECFQGDGLASNGFEQGLTVSEEIPSVADDFLVEGEFTVKQVRLNLFADQELATVAIKIYADDNGTPGEVIETTSYIVPSDQLIIGANLGYLIYQVTVDLPEPIILSSGKYWLQPIAYMDFGAFWEMTSTGSNLSTAKVLTPDNTWIDTNYQAVFFVSGDCNSLSTPDADLTRLSFAPNPVEDILTFNSADGIKDVHIYNLIGQLIGVRQPVGQSVSLADLSPGVYLLQVKLTTGEQQTLKIIKN